MIGVSIIICCFNSAHRLPETIAHIGKLNRRENISVQVLVVDNSSTDNTSAVADTELGKFSDTHLSFKIIQEPKAGLSFAREAGVDAATFEYLLFCDDDNWLDSEYISEMVRLFETRADVAAVGGTNKPYFESDPPDWFKYFPHSYAVGEQSKKEIELLTGEKYLVGAGMGFRKSAYKRVISKGYQFYLKDRTGSKLTGGGDVELSYLFRLAGFQIAASSKLILQHYMPANRLTVEYLKKVWQSYPHSWLIFEAYKIFLLGKVADHYLSRNYWIRKSMVALLANFKIVKNYVRAKLQGNPVSYLPIETGIQYNLYVIRNAGALVDLIKELKLIRERNA